MFVIITLRKVKKERATQITLYNGVFRAEDVAQWQCLPSPCKALGSIFNTTRKKNINMVFLSRC
jgi:hypothetical protein